MDLSEKGAAATVAPGFNSLIATMKWQAAADFDFSAIGVRPDGTQNMIYFGNLGDYGADGMILSGDAGVGDSGGDNQEQLTMVDLSQYDKVALIVSDYGAIIGGGNPARFDQGVDIDIQDDKGTSHSVHLDANAAGNCACIATIEKQGPFWKLVNQSAVTTFKSSPRNSQEYMSAFGL